MLHSLKQYKNIYDEIDEIDLSNGDIEVIQDFKNEEIEYNLCKIYKINLSNNKLINIENIKYFKNLIELNISYNNKLSNLNGLQYITRLKILLLNNNNIHCVSSLQPLSYLKNLNYLTIYDNPICLIPHFNSIIKQIISSSNKLKIISSKPCSINDDDQYQNIFSDSNKNKLLSLQNENQALKQMLSFYENSLKKQFDENNQTFDFEKWRNIFINHLKQEFVFLKQEVENKKKLKNIIKERDEKISKLQNENESILLKFDQFMTNNLLSINNKFNDKLNEMNMNINNLNKNINFSKDKLYKFTKKTRSENEYLLNENKKLLNENEIKQEKINGLEVKFKNQERIKEFYCQQIVSLTKENKKQKLMINNYQRKINDLIKKFYKIKNEQYDINISISMSLQTYLKDINGLKSNFHRKQNQIIYLNTFKMIKTKKLIQSKFDEMNKFYFNKYESMNILFNEMDKRINKISNKFDKIIDITDKKQSVLIQQINDLKMERDQQQSMNIQSIDDIKDKEEEQSLIIRKTPRKLQESPENISKLDNLIKLTKRLLHESEDEKIVKQLFTS